MPDATRRAGTPRPASGGSDMVEHDLVIRNAFIVDGSGSPGYYGAIDRRSTRAGICNRACRQSGCCTQFRQRALTQQPAHAGEIAARDGIITVIGATGAVRGLGTTEIDAGGKLVTPGWVDIHSVRCFSSAFAPPGVPASCLLTPHLPTP